MKNVGLCLYIILEPVLNHSYFFLFFSQVWTAGVFRANALSCQTAERESFFGRGDLAPTKLTTFWTRLKKEIMKSS